MQALSPHKSALDVCDYCSRTSSRCSIRQFTRNAKNSGEGRHGEAARGLSVLDNYMFHPLLNRLWVQQLLLPADEDLVVIFDTLVFTQSDIKYCQDDTYSTILVTYFICHTNVLTFKINCEWYTALVWITEELAVFKCLKCISTLMLKTVTKRALEAVIFDFPSSLCFNSQRAWMCKLYKAFHYQEITVKKKWF